MKYTWESESQYYKRLAQQCFDVGDYENWHYYEWLAEECRKEEQKENAL